MAQKLKKTHKSSNPKIKELKLKCDEFLEDRKKANNVIDILTQFEKCEDDQTLQLACIKTCHKLFNSLIVSGDMYLAKFPKTTEDIDDLGVEDKYRHWLYERYGNCIDHMMTFISHDNTQLQEFSLCSLMKFIQAECGHPLRKVPKGSVSFPQTFQQQIVLRLLSNERQLNDLIERFQEYTEFDDVRYFVMKSTLKCVKEFSESDKVPSSSFLWNVFTLMENLSMPSSAPQDNILTKMLSAVPETESTPKMCSYKDHRKLYTSLWLEFLKLQLPASLYKKVLLVLADKVFPNMTSPLLLADFLTKSYNIGGSISLLALNGLFILVNSYNLNYPDFYEKLYALFEPSVFHVKYKARFFYLSDLFLTSTHLPSYLVAAFIKRLSRLSLTAPPSGLTIIIPFIFNLLYRHPKCKVLVNRPDQSEDLASDPYKMEETDPSKCCAIDSSLWEIKALQNHYHPSISSDSKKFNYSLPQQEIDLSNTLEVTVDELFENELKKKVNQVPMTFDKADFLFANKEDRCSKMWSMS